MRAKAAVSMCVKQGLYKRKNSSRVVFSSLIQNERSVGRKFCRCSARLRQYILDDITRVGELLRLALMTLANESHMSDQ